jgi:hypothetical protein
MKIDSSDDQESSKGQLFELETPTTQLNCYRHRKAASAIPSSPGNFECQEVPTRRQLFKPFFGGELKTASAIPPSPGRFGITQGSTRTRQRDAV